MTNPQAIADGSNLSIGDSSLLTLLPEATIPASSISSAAPAVTAVPEPGTLALVGAAFASLVFVRRVRRR
jgi:hypothetical protein